VHFLGFSRRFATALLPLVLIWPSVSWAHAILEDSTPAIGGTAKAGQIDLTLRYNSRIDKGRSRLTLTAPNQSQQTVKIDPDGAPEVMTAHLMLTPGAYSVRWQVLAVDGHITRGDVPFTVTGP
jgi:copper resistance protein C